MGVNKWIKPLVLLLLLLLLQIPLWKLKVDLIQYFKNKKVFLYSDTAIHKLHFSESLRDFVCFIIIWYISHYIKNYKPFSIKNSSKPNYSERTFTLWMLMHALASDRQSKQPYTCFHTVFPNFTISIPQPWESFDTFQKGKKKRCSMSLDNMSWKMSLK